jgi:hypothetical protein
MDAAGCNGSAQPGCDDVDMVATGAAETASPAAAVDDDDAVEDEELLLQQLNEAAEDEPAAGPELNMTDAQPATEQAGAAAGSTSVQQQQPSLDAGDGPGCWHHAPLPTPRLLLLALTAASCHEAFDLERLEFLGDVVLKVLASCCVMRVSRGQLVVTTVMCAA